MIDFAQRFDSLTFAQQRALVPALEIFAEFTKAYAGPTGSVVLPKSETRRRLTKDAAARFRAMLVADMWEPDLRAELVDRIVAAFEAGYFDAPTRRRSVSRNVPVRRRNAVGLFENVTKTKQAGDFRTSPPPRGRRFINEL